MTDDGHAVNAAVGRHVRQAIQEAGSNLRATAGQAGLSYRSVLRYVSGERDMPVPVLLALVAASGADLIRLMTQLQAETHPDPAHQSGFLDRLPEPALDPAGASSSELVAERVRAHLQLNQQMQALGVTRLAARSIGPIDTDELLAIAEVVQEIVLELRES